MLRKLLIFIIEYFLKYHSVKTQKLFNYLHNRVIDEIGYYEQIRQNTNIDTVIDVGVHKGTPHLYETFKECSFLLVDPVDDFLEVKPERYKFIKKGLGNKNQQKKFYIHQNSGLSSFKEELRLGRSIESEPTETTNVEIVTLDNLIKKELTPSNSIGIKIDAQGYEYEILEGLTENIERVEFIIIENNILPRYKETKLFSELTSFLLKKDFYFLNILNPSSTIPRYSYDCLFLHKNNPIFKLTK